MMLLYIIVKIDRMPHRQSGYAALENPHEKQWSCRPCIVHARLTRPRSECKAGVWRRLYNVESRAARAHVQRLRARAGVVAKTYDARAPASESLSKQLPRVFVCMRMKRMVTVV